MKAKPINETRIQELERRVHNLESLLRHHKLRETELLEERDILNHLILKLAYRSKMELAEEILYRLDKGCSKQELENVILESLREDMGDRVRIGRAQPLVNYLFDGVIESIEEDYPGISTFEKNLFCCMMTGVKARLLRLVFGFNKDNQVYYAQRDLIKRIWKDGNGRRVKYAELLKKKDCAYWKNLLPLHNLTVKRNGKAKKDKN